MKPTMELKIIGDMLYLLNTDTGELTELSPVVTENIKVEVLDE